MKPVSVSKQSHPKGVYLVAATEMWERFSFFSIVGLMPLFLTAIPRTGGFGWSKADAVTLVGIYSGLAFSAPSIGGWISSKYWGERRSIFRGGLMIATGNAMLVLSLCFLDILGVRDTLLNNAPVLGHLFVYLPDLSGHLRAIYYAQAGLFAGGLVLTCIGTGLLKPAISSIVNSLYDPADINREAGFSIFMLGIYIGAMLANFVSGTVGEEFGWYYGFMTAAIGMCCGLTSYFLLQKKYLGSAGLSAAYQQKNESGHKIRIKLTRTDWIKLLALVVLSIFTVIYTISYNQMFGLFNLAVQESVDRRIGAYEVPVTWFLSIGTIAFVLLTPLSLKLFSYRQKIKKPLDVCQKTFLGFFFLAVGYLIFMLGILHQTQFGLAKINMIWIVASYIFFGIGEIFLWPAQIAAASALAPKHLVSFVVGTWYITFGLGGYLSGIVGAAIIDIPLIHAIFWLWISLVAMSACLLMLRPVLLRWMAR